MEYFLKVKKLHPDAIVPTYAHGGDAGMDLFSVEECEILPMSLKLVKTGIAIELPEGTEGQVRSKSGIALKNGVFVLNSPGTVDESFRGEICVILYNLSKAPFKIEKGQKIAQLVINKVCYVKTVETDELSNTVRGEGGFGSTGLKL